MVKKIFMLIYIVLLLMLCGCEGKNIRKNFEDTIIPHGGGFYESLNDNGIFFDKQGVIYMLDPKTGISAPLCSKVNCDHRGKSRDNQHPTCDAYFAEAIGYSAIVGDKLYCLVRISDEEGGSRSYFSKEFYVAETNGTGRRLLFRADDIQYGNCGRYEDGYFLYGYYNTETPDGEELDKEEDGMCIVNLETEKVTRIHLDNDHSDRIWAMTMYQGNLFYGVTCVTENLTNYDYGFLSDPDNFEVVNDMYRNQIWKYDIETGKKELVFETDFIPELSLGYGKIFYSSDCKEYTVRDMISGEEHSIIKNGKGRIGTPSAMCEEGIIFIEDDHVELWRYGTEDIEKIGPKEENQRFNIKGITSKWVYAFVYKEDGEMKSAYCPKEDFMKGKFEWHEYDIG